MNDTDPRELVAGLADSRNLRVRAPVGCRRGSCLRLLWWLALLGGTGVRAERIYWYSVAGAVNETSAGVPMSAAMSFELGVFSGGFVPGPSNQAQWAANWVPAQRVSYSGVERKFAGLFTVANNTAPFTVGKAAYVWGFQGGVATSEWILFRHPAWSWPAPNPMNPLLVYWNAAAATAIVGTIDADGSPVLMRSAAVTGAVSPPTTWQQWNALELAGEPRNGPLDDPDRDGTNNLLEFVFGTPPKQAGAPPVTSVEVVTVGGERFLQLTVPRRMDHPAALTVQVSADLTTWSAGPAFTTTVSNTPAALVVRDLTPLAAGVVRRFMRLQAELPAP
ncbi:MAG: hypothetical protein NTW21_20580 [Verrucomicrobia bacterium]|nr:hypothetical protein [Verrucomicrobiota bacterium]